MLVINTNNAINGNIKAASIASSALRVSNPMMKRRLTPIFVVKSDFPACRIPCQLCPNKVSKDRAISAGLSVRNSGEISGFSNTFCAIGSDSVHKNTVKMLDAIRVVMAALKKKLRTVAQSWVDAAMLECFKTILSMPHRAIFARTVMMVMPRRK